MNIIKILRVYLIFILVITGVSSLGYVPGVKHYFAGQFASIIHSDSENKNFDKVPVVQAIDVQSTLDSISEKLRRSRSGKNNLLNFEITNDAEKTFAKPGEKEAQSMQLIFKTKDKSVIFDSLKLKVSGTNPYNIEKIYISNNDEILASGKRDGEYFRFNLNYKIKEDTKEIFKIKVDLSDKLETNDRLRLDIEKEEDLEIFVDGKTYSMNENYPIKGPFLTIASPRHWTKNSWNPPRKEIIQQ